MRPSSNLLRGLALATLVAALGGCSEYLDRRDTIALSGGNSVDSNEVSQMVDPWPRASENKNIAFDGNVMEGAMQRYRTGKVYAPQGIGTASAYQAPSGSPSSPSGQNNTTPVGPTVSQVK
jgi:hypothetical protein